MPHLDDDQLVLLALGDEALSAAAADHLDGCAECATEYATLRHVAGLASETQDLADLPALPERVWTAIAAQTLDLDPAPPATPVPDRTGTRTGTAPPATGRPDSSRPGGRPVAGSGPGRRRGSSGLLRQVLVALVGVAVGVGATLGVGALRGKDSGPSTVVASGTFAAKAPAAEGAHGTVSVVDTGHGRQLRITVGGMPAPQGIYEAWLYNPSTGGMIPLGAMRPQGGEFDVTGQDLAAYTVVDVSAQTFDGAQGHGQSMLQAPLS